MTESEIKSKYLNQVFVLNKKFSYQYGDFTGLDDKMLVRVTRINRAPDCDDEKAGNAYDVTLDFSEFEERNKQFETNCFYDSNGIPRLKWSESKCYPKNKKENVFVYESDFIELMTLIQDSLSDELNKIKLFIKENNLTEAAKFLNLEV